MEDKKEIDSLESARQYLEDCFKNEDWIPLILVGGIIFGFENQFPKIDEVNYSLEEWENESIFCGNLDMR